jgi:tetratricopeptide (TPR) repeat protein
VREAVEADAKLALVPRTGFDGMSNAAAGSDPSASTLDARLAGVPTAVAEALRAARHALDLRDADAAQQALARASGAERHPEYLRLLGVTRHLQGRHPEAVALLRNALESAPGDAPTLINLGLALRETGEIDAAMASLRRACEVAPGLAAGWYNLGRLLARNSRPAEAHAAFERALACDPSHEQARLHHADMLRTFGRIDEAVAGYRSVLGGALASDAWIRLSNIKTVRFGHDECAELERLFTAPGTPPDDRIRAGFAWIKALEDCDRYGEAFAVMAAANGLQRRRVQWDAVQWQAQTARVLRAFERRPEGSRVAQGSEVIFVVSMPRSGSTLVEQVLASHPDVEGANELSDLGDVLQAESDRRGSAFPTWVADATPDDWQRLGREYLERTARWRTSRPRFTDKGLDNWRYVGAAMAMLPGARFVDCRRDPVETCLSCFRQLFSRGQAFTYDLQELAAFWRSYDHAIRTWAGQYPAAVRSQSHERLVADADTEVRALLAFCGLEFDPACLRPHDTARAVRTISAAQVREPMRADTARAWRYGDLLMPLRLGLEQAVA